MGSTPVSSLPLIYETARRRCLLPSSASLQHAKCRVTSVATRSSCLPMVSDFPQDFFHWNKEGRNGISFYGRKWRRSWILQLCRNIQAQMVFPFARSHTHTIFLTPFMNFHLNFLFKFHMLVFIWGSSSYFSCVVRNFAFESLQNHILSNKSPLSYTSCTKNTKWLHNGNITFVCLHVSPPKLLKGECTQPAASWLSILFVSIRQKGAVLKNQIKFYKP
jgi:hypothetical protein